MIIIHCVVVVGAGWSLVSNREQAEKKHGFFPLVVAATRSSRPTRMKIYNLLSASLLFGSSVCSPACCRRLPSKATTLAEADEAATIRSKMSSFEYEDEDDTRTTPAPRESRSYRRRHLVYISLARSASLVSLAEAAAAAAATPSATN